MTDTTTATALLDAAERAFATDGLDSASLRGIMRRAAADPGSIHYHYGSRDGLVGAVLRRILEPLQNRRLELLGEIRGDPATSELVEALVRPDLEAVLRVGSRDASAGPVVARIYVRPSAFVLGMVEESFRPVAEAFMPHFAAALAHLSPEEISWRIRWVVFGLLGSWIAEAGANFRVSDLESELSRMVTSLTGALEAASSEGTR
jgi:AcrR family transcriptional regulator